MSKFFIDVNNITDSNIKITGEDVKHIKNVLRLKEGDNLLLCDGCQTDYKCRINKIHDNEIIASIINSEQSKTEPPVEITLFQCLPKSDKFEFIIQKSVELGVKKIIPIISERTVIRIDNEREAFRKKERWQKIAYEAAKQCGRGIIPEISMPEKFENTIKQIGEFKLKIIPYEKENKRGIKALLKDKAINNQNKDILKIAILIGPEGGFTEEEVDLATKNSFHSVSLGPRILRTDTAGLNVISVLMYEFEDIGNKSMV